MSFFPEGGADKPFVRITLCHAATILHSAAEDFADHITSEQALALAEIIDAIDDLAESIDKRVVRGGSNSEGRDDWR